MKKVKVCFIVSNIDRAITFEWIVEKLNRSKFEIYFILLQHKAKTHLSEFLDSRNIENKVLLYRSKRDYPICIIQCIAYLRKIRADVVHCHLRDASIIGLLAARFLGIKKRIYSRHHSTFHHQYFPKAVKWDKFSNYLATHIVAISKNVEQVLLKKENVERGKMHLIYHGFDLHAFSSVPSDEIEILRNKYLPKNFDGLTIGIISRYIHLKGHSYIIEAAGEYLKKYPNSFFVFANANGKDSASIKKLISESIPKGKYIEIEFEENLFALYQLFDMYIHCPINKEIEAFGQTYVEALAAGLPSIFTLSGVAAEFIEHKKNAWVVPFENSAAIYEGLKELSESETLRKKISEGGRQSVQIFNLSNFIEKLETLYITS